MIPKPGFKLYKKFNRKKGLPLSVYKKVLKDCGLNVQMDHLKFSMERALRHGFAEKVCRRYRMPWRLCDYHIARTLGVKVLLPPRLGSVLWKKDTAVQDEKNHLHLDGNKDQNYPGSALVSDGINETTEKPDTIKTEEEDEEARSAHYLITDYWNSMEGFFGTLETEKVHANGDFTRPVVPLPRRVWKLKTEPVSKEPMWTFVTPSESTVQCKKESKLNFIINSQTSQDVTKPPVSPKNTIPSSVI